MKFKEMNSFIELERIKAWNFVDRNLELNSSVDWNTELKYHLMKLAEQGKNWRKEAELLITFEILKRKGKK